MGDSQQARGKNNLWSPQETKTLINLLLDGAAAGWRDANGTFSKLTVEKRILPVINQTHGCVKTHNHYLNRMKILKGKYLSGVEILRFSSGFGWDPITKRFTTLDEIWADYIKAHPNHKKFRDETFEEFDDLKVIFGNNIATDGNAIALGESTDARTSESIQTEQTNKVEDFPMNIEEEQESPTFFWGSGSRGSSEKLPLRKKQRTNNIHNAGEPIIQREDEDEVHAEMNSLSSITKKLFDLIQEREARQQRETEQREANKKKSNVWEAIKEFSDLEENIRYDAVKVIHQLGMLEVFVSMSIDERYGWIKRNVTV